MVRVKVGIPIVVDCRDLHNNQFSTFHVFRLPSNAPLCVFCRSRGVIRVGLGLGLGSDMGEGHPWISPTALQTALQPSSTHLNMALR